MNKEEKKTKKKEKGFWESIKDAIKDANDNDKGDSSLPLLAGLGVGIFGTGSSIGCDGGGGC